ncbi:amidase domain-containing protein, partial [Bacillus thuringiensis]
MTKKLFVSTVALTISLTCWDSITSLADSNDKTTTMVSHSQKWSEQQSVSPAHYSIMNQKIHIESALAYVQKWWNKRNPDYKIWDPNDCVNYVSQILIAGGFQEKTPPSIAFGGIDPDRNYWYSKKEGTNSFTVSRTWINVEDFYTYWSKTQRVIQPEKLDIMR